MDADDGLSAIEAYFNSNNLQYLDCYCRNGAARGAHWTKYGYGGGYPHNVLMDRDGAIRRWKVGAVINENVALWEQTIKEIVGVS